MPDQICPVGHPPQALEQAYEPDSSNRFGVDWHGAALCGYSSPRPTRNAPVRHSLVGHASACSLSLGDDTSELPAPKVPSLPGAKRDGTLRYSDRRHIFTLAQEPLEANESVVLGEVSADNREDAPPFGPRRLCEQDEQLIRFGVGQNEQLRQRQVQRDGQSHQHVEAGIRASAFDFRHVRRSDPRPCSEFFLRQAFCVTYGRDPSSQLSPSHSAPPQPKESGTSLASIVCGLFSVACASALGDGSQTGVVMRTVFLLIWLIGCGQSPVVTSTATHAARPVAELPVLACACDPTGTWHVVDLVSDVTTCTNWTASPAITQDYVARFVDSGVLTWGLVGQEPFAGQFDPSTCTLTVSTAYDATPQVDYQRTVRFCSDVIAGSTQLEATWDSGQTFCNFSAATKATRMSASSESP